MQTIRIYYQCKAGHRLTQDYEVHPDANNKIGFDDIFRMEGEQKIRQYDEGRQGCQCGERFVKVRHLKATSNSNNRKCTASCKNAQSEECDCSCNGANHGIAHKPAQQQPQLLAEEVQG
jgi:hypothetical protein